MPLLLLDTTGNWKAVINAHEDVAETENIPMRSISLSKIWAQLPAFGRQAPLTLELF
jgi:hypothetical protein